MSDSSEGEESRSFYENSDGEGSTNSSLASSLASHLQGRTKRQRPPQIVGKAWVLRGEITINQLLGDSLDAKIQNTKSQLQAALGANFENLFQKMSSCVSYFVIFCNLVNFMHVAPAATKVKLQIRGFLQLGTDAKAKTGLDKLMTPALSYFLAGEWDRCHGGLCGNIEYESCMCAEGSWLAIQTTGIYGETNHGKCARKRETAAAAVIY